ncbi:TPA: ATP-binding protein [Vibrio vulnificus]|nr:ATP-binding protein [Vibrio vulnificus]
MKFKKKNSVTNTTPFSRLAKVISVHLTQTIKSSSNKISGEAAEQALEQASNHCAIALHDGQGALLIGGDAVNYAIPLDSKEAQGIFLQAARSAGAISLTQRDLNSAIDALKLNATIQGDEAHISVFNSYINDDFPEQGVILNTHCPDGTALSITNGSVDYVNEVTEVTFKWAPNNGALTYNKEASTKDTPTKLHELFSNLSYEKFMLTMAYASFILTHPRSNGLTFPILYLYGEAGTGKTTVARLITKLLGLGETSVKSQPKSAKDLVANAAQDYVLCFDNCGAINTELSNALCGVATGNTVSDRRLYTNNEIVNTQLHQPLILTSIEFAKQYDLTTRSLFLKADKPAISYSSDTEIFRILDSMLTEAQSWLLETSASAMNLKGLIEPILEHRAGDFCHWLAAFESAVGIEGQLLQKHVHHVQQEALKHQALDHDAVLATIVAIVGEYGKFEGNPTEVHKQLTSYAETLGRLPKQWPLNASAMSNKLNRLTEQLTKQGVEVVSGGTRGTNGRKLIVQPLETVDTVEAHSESISEPLHIPSPNIWDDVEDDSFDDDINNDIPNDEADTPIDQEEANRLVCELLG